MGEKCRKMQKNAEKCRKIEKTFIFSLTFSYDGYIIRTSTDKNTNYKHTYTNMTTAEKIQMLTGALAAVLYNGNDRFIKFETITTEQAEEMITSESFHMGTSTSGDLWISQCGYFNSRWVFADKSLAVIANA